MGRACVIALVLLAAASPPVSADIYKYIDRNGVTHFSDKSLGPGYKLILKSKKPPPRRSAKRNARFNKNRRAHAALIDRIAGELELDRALVHAVIRAESAYDPNAESNKGAVGLMQLMPQTAKRYGVKDRRNPAENVYGGTRYLRDLIKQFDDIVLALAAYNAGENAVLKYGKKVPPYRETQNYVRKVLKFYKQNAPDS